VRVHTVLDCLSGSAAPGQQPMSEQQIWCSQSSKRPDDPKREHLTGWRSFIFSAMGIMGFLLGAILLVAVSGLTQRS
jgi:hypothetical protein